MIKIDLDNSEVKVETNDGTVAYGLGTAEAFAILSDIWLRAGWDTKYVYSFTWLGRPIIQLPEDMVRIQEVIFKVGPDVIIETGVAHGGSLVFYASLCKAVGRGRVVGIDVEIRPHNRKAIEAHELSGYITLVEGSSIDPRVIEKVKSLVHSGERAIVILDSNHTKQHVLSELRAYSELVSLGSYIVACDGIMGNVVGAPRSSPDWLWNNPRAAAEEFVQENHHFLIEEPEIPFNEGIITQRVTYWPNGFLRRVRQEG